MRFLAVLKHFFQSIKCGKRPAKVCNVMETSKTQTEGFIFMECNEQWSTLKDHIEVAYYYIFQVFTEMICYSNRYAR